jgi:hypothetical protein
MQNRSWRNWLGVATRVLAGLSLILVIVNGGLSFANRSTRAEVNARQQYINQSVQLGRIEQDLVRAAVTAAVNNRNARLGDLLRSNGINYQVNPATPTGAPAATTTSPTAEPAGRR